VKTCRAIGVAAVAAVCALTAAVLAVAAPAAAAARRDDPPDVTGLPVAEATARLADWNKAVLFRYDPPPDVDLGVDPSRVVVSRWSLAGPVIGTSANRPVVDLVLGRRVPNLVGLTRLEAATALGPVALGLAARPDEAESDWRVTAQEPAADQIVEFVRGRSAVLVDFAAPPGLTPTIGPDPRTGLSTPELVLLGGSGLGVALLIVLGAVLATRAARRRSTRRPPELAPERVEVRVGGGAVSGPDVAESGPSLSIRLVSHPDPGTYSVEEGPP
jgi:hypothetical protein